MPRRFRVYISVSALVVLADQLTKLWARTSLPVDGAGRGIRVPIVDGYFDLVLAHNPGAAFSFLAGADGGRIVLTALGLVAVAAISWMAARAREDQLGLIVALSLMVGGAVGNLIDRIRFGTVTDFVLWHWHEHTWPVFNVADACLSVSIAVFVLHIMRGGARTRRAAQSA